MVVAVDWSFLYVIICFLIIWFVGKRTLFARLEKILNERHEMIEGAQQAADSDEEFVDTARAEIRQQISTARTEAFAIRSELRNEALEKQKDLIAEARKKADERIADAQRELDSAIDEAKRSLKQESEEMAGSIASRVLERTA